MATQTSYDNGVTPGQGANKEDLRRRRPSVIAGARASALDSEMLGAAASGGGVVAGAHPEFDTETPLDKVVAGIKKLLRPKPKKVM